MMATKKDYATFSTIFQQILEEPDVKLALDILKDQITPIKKSKVLAEEDRDLLLNIKVPAIRKELEDKLVQQTKKQKKAKTNPEVDLDEDQLYYASLDEDEEDEEDTLVKDLSWQDLNPEELPYAVWLHQIGLREFFPLQEDTLFKILACICLVNSAAIPTRSPNFTTEGELPLIYLFGRPQTGKGALADFIGNHYLFSKDSKASAYQVIGDNATLNALRDLFDSACNLGEGILRESCVHVNDFVPELILNGKWSKCHAPFIAVKRSEAIARVSNNGRKSQDVQAEFWMWCLKVISSNNHPKELISTLQGKFDRRIICVPVDKRGSGLNQYNWGNLRDEYQAIWKGNVPNYRKKFLKPILKKNDTDFYPIPEDRVNQSRVLISVGLFTGIFESFEDACEHFGEYWQFIQEKYAHGQDDLFLASLEAFITEQEERRLSLQARKSFVGQTVRSIEFDLDTLHITCTQGGNKEKEKNKLIQWMRIRGYELNQQIRGGRPTFYFSKSM